MSECGFSTCWSRLALNSTETRLNLEKTERPNDSLAWFTLNSVSSTIPVGCIEGNVFSIQNSLCQKISSLSRWKTEPTEKSLEMSLRPQFQNSYMYFFIYGKIISYDFSNLGHLTSQSHRKINAIGEIGKHWGWSGLLTAPGSNE